MIKSLIRRIFLSDKKRSEIITDLKNNQNFRTEKEIKEGGISSNRINKFNLDEGQTQSNKHMRKITLFIATSLDGYIAKPNDDPSFLKSVEKEGEDYGYAKFTETIDTLIVGRKTYDYVLKEIGSSHYDNGQRDVYVITRTERQSVGRTVFYTGNLTDLVTQLKSQNGKNIYCDGGAEIINELLKHGLIDEFIISVIPVLLGNGTRLFKDGRPEQSLEFVSAITFDTGLAQLHYKRKE